MNNSEDVSDNEVAVELIKAERLLREKAEKLLDKKHLELEYMEISLRICKDVKDTIEKQDAERIKELEAENEKLRNDERVNDSQYYRRLHEDSKVENERLKEEMRGDKLWNEKQKLKAENASLREVAEQHCADAVNYRVAYESEKEFCMKVMEERDGLKERLKEAREVIDETLLMWAASGDYQAQKKKAKAWLQKQ